MLLLCCCGYIYSLLRWRKKLRAGQAGEKKRSPSPGSQGARGSGENGAPKLIMFNNKITYAETVAQFDEEKCWSRGPKQLMLMEWCNSLRPDTSIEETLPKEAENL
ncbi:UNVERIFIED_CONTAM: putative LRR receptor-like serine/threonine-protein kinase [Sesamum radiatum]|uniref:LRR receptor-like serine/threonine-protein kinase n=1 Tax=Sesamum radiatum TaxID=300843 RepID=A0AAW2PYN1_SESRA